MEAPSQSAAQEAKQLNVTLEREDGEWIAVLPPPPDLKEDEAIGFPAPSEQEALDEARAYRSIEQSKVFKFEYDEKADTYIVKFRQARPTQASIWPRPTRKRRRPMPSSSTSPSRPSPRPPPSLPRSSAGVGRAMVARHRLATHPRSPRQLPLSRTSRPGSATSRGSYRRRKPMRICAKRHAPQYRQGQLSEPSRRTPGRMSAPGTNCRSG